MQATGSGYETVWNEVAQTWETKTVVNVENGILVWCFSLVLVLYGIICFPCIFFPVVDGLQFFDDKARIILIDDMAASCPTLLSNPARKNARTRAFILTDLSQNVSQQLAILGRIHACGQWKESTFFLVTTGFAGDFKRMICLAHNLETQGASIEVLMRIFVFISIVISNCCNYYYYLFLQHDNGIANENTKKEIVLNVDMFSEHGIASINAAAVKSLRQFQEFQPWHQIVCPNDFLTGGSLEMTYHSEQDARRFLSRLQCLPIAVQKSAMEEVEGQVFINAAENDISGTFRGKLANNCTDCTIDCK